MKKYALAATALTVAAGAANAGGLDRSYTPIDIIFEKGNYAELSFGFTSPNVEGGDFIGNAIANVANDYGIFGAGVKLDFGEDFSFALIFDQPYGADVQYGGAPAATLLGGTLADAESNAITALLRYNVNERIAIYGGPRMVRAKGNITLSGLAYGPLNGYNVKFASDNGVGFVAGAAYQIPDIAFRAALTYHSPVNLRMTTTDSLGTPAANTPTKLPQTIELAVQSGVAKDTLVFGSVRWSEWDKFTLNPPNPFVPNLAQLDNTTTYELGVGRRLTDKLSASIAVSYESGGDDVLISPLAPTNGQTAVTIGAKYQVNDMVTLSGGVRYTWLGDGVAETGTPDAGRAHFRNNEAISGGIKIGVNF